MNQVADQAVDRTDRFRPAIRDVADRRALRDPAFLADDPADPIQFPRHALVHPDDVVKRVGDLPGQPGPVIRQADGEIAAFECRKRGEQLSFIKPIAVEAGAVSGGLGRRCDSLRGLRRR